MSSGPVPHPLQWLRDARERGLSYQPVFYAAKTKGPTTKEWNAHDSKLEEYRDGQNVGIKTGTEVATGRYLVDVDFDWTDGLPLAKKLLPNTAFGFGRASRKVGHAFYTTTSPVVSKKFCDVDDQPFVELRGTKTDGTIGFQTMVPPSIHPSGERLEFRTSGDPTHDDTVPRRVLLYAIGCLLLKHVGQRGLLHEVRLALAGFLLRLGVTETEVIEVAQAVAEVRGNDVADVATAVRSTSARLKNGEAVTGAEELRQAIGDHGPKVVARLRKWLQPTSEQRGDNRQGATQDNIRHKLGLLGVELWLDEFAQKYRVRYGEYTGDLEDAIRDDVWLEIDARYRFRPALDFFTKVMQRVARENKVHPVRAYLSALTWDGVPRIDRWLTTYGRAKNTPLTRAIASIVLIAAVRRVRHPGCKFDELLVLISPQGTDKSTALRSLCPNDSWFSDDLPLGVDSKQVIERTAGKWWLEASELVGIGKREAESLKSFLSRSVDGPVRLAYERLAVEVPRQFVIVGTTNSHQFLKDKTGNRRFWPVRVEKFETAALRRDRDQLWAEAARREESGESIRLDPELYGAAAKEQEARQIEDPWTEILREWLNVGTPEQADRVLLRDVWTTLGLATDRLDERAAERVNAVMQMLGYEKKNARVEGKVAKCWCRVAAEQLQLEVAG